MQRSVSELEALSEARRLIDGRINAIIKDRNQRILASDEWYLKSKTKRLAAYFCELGFRILKCKFKEERSSNDGVARLVFKNRKCAIPLVKKLAHMTNDVYELTLDGLDGADKGGLLQVCAAFERNGWVTCDKGKQVVRITRAETKKAIPFWNGGWAELVNKWIVEKTLEDYARQKHLRFDVFTDLKLAQMDRVENSPDMQLDVVAMLNDRVYVFETKTGTDLGLDKWVDRARLFSSDLRSRFVTCCAGDDIPRNMFQPFTLVPLSSLDRWLWNRLDKDFSEPGLPF